MSNPSYAQLVKICVFLGCACLIFCCVLVGVLTAFYKKRKHSRFERAERELQFTLPDRENSYVRERLQGPLKSEEERKRAEVAVTMKEMDVRLEYVRRTISKLKALPLTPADRLAVNRISKTVTFYALKNALAPDETRRLNDCFASLLKMQAKYVC
jgi:hypothetical protein